MFFYLILLTIFLYTKFKLSVILSFKIYLTTYVLHCFLLTIDDTIDLVLTYLDMSYEYNYIMVSN